MQENKSLIKSTRIISAATLVSRILGFVRDVIIAKFFGTGASAEAFVVAFRIPNLLRNIVGEGATNSAVVPVLSRLKEAGKVEEFWQLANCLLNILLVLLAASVLLGELFTPYIVRAIAPGFTAVPAKLQLTIRLTRLLFPYIALIGLAAYAMAVLNSLKHFALPALAPAMLNISLIVSALVLCPRLKEPVDGLAVGALVGGLLQLGLQFPLLVKQGLFKKRSSVYAYPQLTLLKNKVSQHIKEVGSLFFPRTLGIAVYQLNIFVDTIFASLALIVGEGAPAALQYASRLVEFPLALFAVALAQAALPTMSGLSGREDLNKLKSTVSFSLRSVFIMMIPSTVGMAVLAQPLVKVIFERGNFTSYSTNITALVLVFYCLGLTGYSGIKILASCCYSLKDTFTPGMVACVALLINIILNSILMYPLKMAGLALATASSVTVNFILLLFVLQKRVGRFTGLWSTLAKVTLASGTMALSLYLAFNCSGPLLGHQPLPAVKLGFSIVLAIAVYTGALKIFAKEEAEIFLGWILRRR